MCSIYSATHFLCLYNYKLQHMKKSKLFGSRLVENVFLPKTPKVIMLADNDSINQHFEEGDILDANSIRKLILKLNQGQVNDDSEMLEIFNGSQNNEPRTLDEVLGLINHGNVYDRCLFVSFIDRDTGLRTLYYCTADARSTNPADWKRVLLDGDVVEDENALHILPFDGYATVFQFEISSAINGKIIWDANRKRFFCQNGNTVYINWGNANEYGEPSLNNGVKPKKNVLYYHKTNGEMYTWDGESMIKVSGDCQKLLDNIKRIIESEIDNMLNL